jgi:two-component system, NarL family, invasion response regulator UvrY
MSITRVLIADDHSAIRNGVRHILNSKFPFMEFHEAKDASEIYILIKEHDYDLIILDIDLPGRNGLEVLHSLKTYKNDIPVLVFSFYKEEQVAIRAYKSGAFGYLSKDTADKDLIDVVSQMLEGKKYMSPNIADKLISLIGNPDMHEPYEKLSDREYQTFKLISSGKTVSEIATELSLSLPTISTYRARILEKMGMKNNAELINYAIRNNLI